MEEESNNRRLVLAAALCLLVLMIWQAFAPPPPPPAKPAPTPVATAPEGEVPETRTATRAPALQPPPGRAAPKPRSFTFSGKVPTDRESIRYEATVTNVGGGIERFALPDYFERDKDNRATDEPIGLVDPTVGIPDDREAAFAQAASVRFGEGTSFRVPDRIVYDVVESDGGRVVMRHVTPEGVEIERDYQFREDSFLVEMAVTVRNRSDRPQSYRMEMSNGMRASDAMTRGSGFFANFVPPPDHLQALCYSDGDVERFDFQKIEKSPESFAKAVRWAAVDRQYFLSAVISRDSTPESAVSCRLSAQGGVARAALLAPESTLQPGAEKRHKFAAYLGVKSPSLLTNAEDTLKGAIDYTILGINLAPLCSLLLWILGFFYSFTGSWGVAIVGLTVLVKAILFPLNQRSGKSMRAMAALRPQMEEIKTKFPDDRQRQSEEMMRLYREHNVNPAGGCLPVLIQMPIWFALYRSLWVSVDLYQEGFLWIGDLTTRDPYWILPVSLTVVMFLQQKMTPTTMDPAQQKMMQYTMPLVFGAMMAALPAGLSFYILVNTLLTIVQQHFINRSIGPAQGPSVAREAAT